ncbi:hypothetical protein FHX09_001779 [Rhizobium sp. BK538]|jgi:hypothetical protein|nr:hypothetical protein [Rhizobium sp. BK060]MBB4167948.1 hypothetical protein [Rhizobium sp. BK538]TCM79036.1 hypothetical protein EV291_10440 [Rhizobium sp. BK068]
MSMGAVPAMTTFQAISAACSTSGRRWQIELLLREAL